MLSIVYGKKFRIAAAEEFFSVHGWKYHRWLEVSILMDGSIFDGRFLIGNIFYGWNKYHCEQISKQNHKKWRTFTCFRIWLLRAKLKKSSSVQSNTVELVTYLEDIAATVKS